MGPQDLQIADHVPPSSNRGKDMNTAMAEYSCREKQDAGSSLGVPPPLELFPGFTEITYQNIVTSISVF